MNEMDNEFLNNKTVIITKKISERFCGAVFTRILIINESICLVMLNMGINISELRKHLKLSGYNFKLYFSNYIVVIFKFNKQKEFRTISMEISKFPQLLIIPMDNNAYMIGVDIFNRLENKNKFGYLIRDFTTINNALNFAIKKGFRFCIIIGSNEVKNNLLTIKNLVTFEQITISNADLDSWAKKFKF